MTPNEALATARSREDAAPQPASRTERIRIEQHGFAGILWFAGWLFTIGFLHLPFWKAVLGLLLWPYYLGVTAGPTT